MDTVHPVEGPTGAREVILECQEILAGKRRHLIPDRIYVAARLQYWQQLGQPAQN